MNISRIIKRFPLILVFTYDNVMCLKPRIQTNNAMKYSRWTHRIPSKVMYPENSDNEIEETIKEMNVKKQHKKTKEDYKKPHVKSFLKDAKISRKDDSYFSEEEILSDDEQQKSESSEIGGTTYTTLFNSDPTLSQLMIKVKSRKTRDKFGLMLLEGKRLNQDALSAGLVPKEMFFSRRQDVESLSMPSGVVKLYKVTYKVMQLWSTLQTAPGLFGFYKIPEKGAIKEDPNSLPLTVICDNIRDPGNAGAILRTAAGVGINKILFMKGCTDIWDSKVLRSGSGGHFRVSLEQDVDWEDVNHCLDVNTSVLLADNRERIKAEDSMSSYLPLVPYHSVNFCAFSSIAIVIGGETEGLSKQAILLSRYRNGVRLHIPLANELDSLNTGAALSVILFEIKRQLGRHHDEEVCVKQ